MAFPPSFLEELRSRLPLSGIVAKRVRMVRAGREFKGCCPFHNEKTPSFYVNDDKQFYHCFGCGSHGDIIGFTMRFDHLSFPEAVEILAAQAGLQVPQDTPQEREQYNLEKRLYQVLERATAWFEEQLFSPQGREALNYLRGRGLTEESIKRFHLGFAPNDSQSMIKKLSGEGFSLDELKAVGLIKKSEDRPDHFSFFRNRVIFPVGDRRGRTVAFGGRVMDDGGPKYLNSPDHVLFHKGKLLYGLSRARAAISQGQPIIVVEGYMDVIALVEEGFHGAAAPLGTALTEDQINILWKLLPPPDTRDPSKDYSPILCFDGDNAGIKASARAVERILPMLTAAQTVRVAYLPEGEDPDSLIKRSGKSSMQSILDQAKPMIDVIWDLTLANRRLTTPEERGAFISSIKHRISRIKDESLRSLYNDEIQKRISAAFSWQKTSTKTGKFNRSNKRELFTTGTPDGLSRKQPLNPQKLRERVLLAIMINHPSLFGEFGEDLAQIGFFTPTLEALRQQLVNLLSDDSHEPLDAEELYRQLSGGADTKIQATGLSETLSEATYVHAGFARPDKPVEQARQGWKSIWNKHLQELLQADMQAAKRQYAENASEENLTRLLALRSQIETLNRESAVGDGTDSTLLLSI
ncbi:MAG: DNA primase [Alphaproteobacteria bacterium]|nr:DNA primase [Alphaproteobacteria bacterium]